MNIPYYLYRTLQCWSYQTYRYYYGQDDYGQDDRMRISKNFRRFISRRFLEDSRFLEFSRDF